MKQLAIGLSMAFILVACSTPTPTETVPPAGGVGLANPASVYCTELGYNLVFSDDGSTANCVYPDGSQCEEWAFFRGECGLAFSYCQQNGGKLEVQESVATCVFDDGSTCVEADFFTEKCKKGDHPA